MTKFRLNAGRPATSHRGGPSAFSEKAVEINDDEPIPRGYDWRPNREPDTPLACGDSIPWPITVLIGSGGRVRCPDHGWQPKLTAKEIKRAEQLTRKARQCKTPDQSAIPF